MRPSRGHLSSGIDRTFMVWAKVQLLSVCLAVAGIASMLGCRTSRVSSESSLFPSNPASEQRVAEERAEERLEREPATTSAASASLPIPNVPIPNVPTPNVPTPNVPAPNVPAPNVPAPNVPAPSSPPPETAHFAVERTAYATQQQDDLADDPLTAEDSQEETREEPLPRPRGTPGESDRPDRSDEGHGERGEVAPPGQLEREGAAELKKIRPPPPSGLVRRQDSAIHLDDVVSSVYRTYPLLDAALRNRDIAAGEQLAAVGNYDLHFRGAAEHGPTGFYRTHRHRAGFEQPTLWGGQVFAGYRVGRGNFEPWYRERQTNDGGEFRAGVMVPLARNIDIDPLRAALWRANYGRQLAEPQIQRQLILFVQEATFAYWYWVGSGRRLRIQQTVLQLAVDRNEGLRRQVEEELLDPPDLEDNRRLIVSREAMVIDAARQLDQASYGLSLYLRDERGMVITPSVEQLPDFPEVRERGADDLELDIRRALQNRPELRELELVRRQLEIDLAQATNELLPAIDGVVAGSQDVGAPTGPSRDKSQFELDAGVFVDVPVQRRRARGKQRISEGRIAQVNAQRQLAADQVVMEVQFAHAALNAAYQRIEKARESVTLAEYMAHVERRKFEVGDSDLLLLNLREQQAAEAAEIEVNALLEYFGALADLRAALAIDENP